MDEADEVLAWAESELLRRQDVLRRAGALDLTEYTPSPEYAEAIVSQMLDQHYEVVMAEPSAAIAALTHY